MIKQILFIFSFLITLFIFGYTVRKYISFFKLTKPGFPVRQIGKRLVLMLKVAFGQTKIFRRPVIGFLHAVVFWGFCVILIGSIEMVIDGLFAREKALKFLGVIYDIIMATGDLFAFIVLMAVIVFLFRRLFLNVKRFSGVEMKRISHIDANIALMLILVLMITLIGMNTFYILSVTAEGLQVYGYYPVSILISGFITTSPDNSAFIYQSCWWAHILIIFLFANYLPYSKHFHVFMSVPNVFLSRLEPLGKLSVMESVTREVKIMMNPDTVYSSTAGTDNEEIPARFGVLDIEDVTWKNYFDSLACTECGRCTSACPANITGKKLSPRKIFMDLRARMKEKSSQMIRKGKEYSDHKTLLRDYISEEELWACTLCNACAQECPVNINHPTLIVEMRRYLVMEESSAPGELNTIFSNIENNGAPWQFSHEDRLQWAGSVGLNVPVMAELFARGQKPEYLFWVGSAGAIDDRYKHVSRAFVKILNHLHVNYAILGTEETSSGDVARRAGNEMLFQMQALMIIEILQNYGISKILTCDPHAYNTFKNEYPDLGGNFEVIHHTQFLKKQIETGNLKLKSEFFKGQSVTYHDPCYLGRANDEYESPRFILSALSLNKTEMSRNRSFALCCGAGGGQMFKEAEKGEKEVFIERTEEAIRTGSKIIATACPYCMVMFTDGLKFKNMEESVKNYDIAELVVMNLDL